LANSVRFSAIPSDHIRPRCLAACEAVRQPPHRVCDQ
jgi:hypothetical protein